MERTCTLQVPLPRAELWLRARVLPAGLVSSLSPPGSSTDQPFYHRLRPTCSPPSERARLHPLLSLSTTSTEPSSCTPYQNLARRPPHPGPPCSTHNCLHPPRRLSRPFGYYCSITIIGVTIADATVDVTVSLDCSCACRLGSGVAFAVITVDDVAFDELALSAISFVRCFERRSCDQARHPPLRFHQSRRASALATAAND